MSVERKEVGARMSQVVIHGNTVYLAGVVARNAPGGSVTDQTKDILKSIDGYLRSPAFLEVLQRNLKAMTDLKAFQDQIVQDTARNIGLPLANDIYGLFERLHSVEHAIIGRLKAIEGRLADIEAKLGPDRGQP